ncbi:MAG: hypothetical protein LKI80_08915 [Sporolactobacillus sp.]|nr:hypothetical protein [Sporolactobacillus sp.]
MINKKVVVGMGIIVSSILIIAIILYTGKSSMNQETVVRSADVAVDDTRTIQAAFDTGKSNIVFPKRKKPYIISRTIKIHAHQTVYIQSGAEIKLADHANCIMFQNDINASDIHFKGNGSINANGKNQIRQDSPLGTGLPGETWFGIAILMRHINHFSWKDITLENVTAWGLTLADAKHFSVENIHLDYGKHPPINTDGVHLSGNCNDFVINGVYGKTGDDMVALNADDYGVYAFENGPITNGIVKNIYGSNSYRGVRILSADSLIDQIKIDNISGAFSRSALLYSYPKGNSSKGNFGTIHIGTINASEIMPGYPIIDIAANIGRITIQSIIRIQEQIAADDQYAATILIRSGQTVKTLRVGEITEIDHTSHGYVGIDVAGIIGHLSVSRWKRSATGGTAGPPFIVNEDRGRIKTVQLPNKITY